MLAAYAALNMSLGRFNVYAGVRFESYRSSLESYPSETNFRDPDEHLPIQQRAAVAQRHV